MNEEFDYSMNEELWLKPEIRLGGGRRAEKCCRNDLMKLSQSSIKRQVSNVDSFRTLKRRLSLANARLLSIRLWALHPSIQPLLKRFQLGSHLTLAKLKYPTNIINCKLREKKATAISSSRSYLLSEPSHKMYTRNSLKEFWNSGGEWKEEKKCFSFIGNVWIIQRKACKISPLFNCYF